MRHTYVILAHQAPRQLARLVDRLRAPGVDFVLHVDRRSAASVHAGAHELAAQTDVVVLPARRTPWPGFGHTGVTLDAIDLLTSRGTDPDYVSLLTGQDYPIKTPQRIDARLRSAGGASFLQAFALPRWPGGERGGKVDERGWAHGGMDRVLTWNLEVGGHAMRIPNRRLRVPVRRRLPAGVPLYGGSGYWTLSRTALAAVRRAVDERPDLLRFFRRVYLPHEMFFQTLIADDPAAGPLINDDLRYIDWSAGGAHPKVLSAEDLPVLAASDALFARKFSDEAAPGLLDHLDRELLDR